MNIGCQLELHQGGIKIMSMVYGLFLLQSGEGIYSKLGEVVYGHMYTKQDMIHV